MKRTHFLPWMLFFLATIPLASKAQKIFYSEPEKDDNRRTTNFEIIGKVGGNILIFKNNRADNAISVYDNEMNLIERVQQVYMEDRWINVDFVPYPDFCWLIYQFQRHGVVYCMAAKIDGKGKRISEPIELDTTKIGWSANNKIYTTVFSEDKKRIAVFKINSKNQKNFMFTTMLFDNELHMLDKARMNLEMVERNEYFTDFLVSNQGDLVFGKFIRKSGNDYISDLRFVVKKAESPGFKIFPIITEDKTLDEIKIKVDNANNRVVFNALYYKQRKGSIEGLFSAIYDKAADSIVRQSTFVFNDELRKLAKGPDANLKLAFNDYFITNIITKRDGGYILIGESMYTTTRGSSFNRWDYLNWNNPWSSPLDSYYYSPYYSAWSSPWNRWGNTQATRFHAENILILSLDNGGALEWSNVVPKNQFDDESDALVSHQIMNTGGEIHFIFNQYERKTLLLNNQSIAADGKITRYPTLKNLERGVEFMPRYGKQISARTMIVPCQYRNYLTFAKVDF